MGVVVVVLADGGVVVGVLVGVEEGADVVVDGGVEVVEVVFEEVLADGGVVDVVFVLDGAAGVDGAELSDDCLELF